MRGLEQRCRLGGLELGLGLGFGFGFESGFVFPHWKMKKNMEETSESNNPNESIQLYTLRLYLCTSDDPNRTENLKFESIETRFLCI